MVIEPCLWGCRNGTPLPSIWHLFGGSRYEHVIFGSEIDVDIVHNQIYIQYLYIYIYFLYYVYLEWGQPLK